MSKQGPIEPVAQWPKVIMVRVTNRMAKSPTEAGVPDTDLFCS